jgi:hypothetical protein
MTLRALSEEVSRVGRMLSADAINKIENGRHPAGEIPAKLVRRADVDDVVALALALNVSPLTLLLPPRSGDEPVALTGTVTVTGRDAWRWAEGRITTPDSDDLDRQEAYDALTLPPERRRFERLPAVQTARRLYETLAELTKTSPPGQTAAHGRVAQRRHRQLGTEIADLVEQLPEQ